MKVSFDAAGEFGDHYNGEVLGWSLKITGIDDETTRIEKTAALSRRQVQETTDREDHPHERAQQIQEKPGQVENWDTRQHCWSVCT